MSYQPVQFTAGSDRWCFNLISPNHPQPLPLTQPRSGTLFLQLLSNLLVYIVILSVIICFKYRYLFFYNMRLVRRVNTVKKINIQFVFLDNICFTLKKHLLNYFSTICDICWIGKSIFLYRFNRKMWKQSMMNAVFRIFIAVKASSLKMTLLVKE